jgi:cytochrome d ubiquinol oxidase subunit II
VVGNAAGAVWSSWLNPTSVLIGILGVASGAYLAAVFLAGDARRAGLPELEDAFRRRALAAGAVTGALALGGLAVIRADARELFDGLTSWPGAGLVALSAAAGLGTLALVATRRFGVARLTAAAAVVAITVGWAVAQRPYLLPGELTVDGAAAGDATLGALLLGVGIGLIVLVPSLWWLYRLVLQGRLDQDYEPLDQRFRPLGDLKGGGR